MVFPWQLSLSLTKYVASQKLHHRSRFPLVLMLEPTFACNLSCAGCGRVREGHAIGNRALTVQECLTAVDEAGAPVVSIAGGEPLLHPQIGEIVKGIVAKRRFVHLCTNGMVLERSLRYFQPSPYFSFVFHVDGLAATHDRIAGRQGVFDTAMQGIGAAKRAGFQVRTNTTVFKGTDPNEILALFALLSKLGVDGIMVAPAFGYEEVDADIFLSREEAVRFFQPVCGQSNRFPFYNSPLYLEFLTGKRDLQCVPWSTPTRNPRGWRRPCYLITDGYCDSFDELMNQTQWEKYGVANDPRCANCMVHSGFEASAMEEIGKSLPKLWQMAKWSLFG